jgi:hypothetical protein
MTNLNRDDQQTAYLLVKALLDEGLKVWVYDSEDYPVQNSDDLDEILDALGTTDDDTIETDKYSFWLVYGNEPDELVSDYSCKPEHMDAADAIVYNAYSHL